MAITEENVAATTVEASAADPSPAETTVAAVAGEAKKKEVKPKAPKKPYAPSHPKYFEMISEAIGSLKERTGSSQYAITKFIVEKYGAKLPPNFNKIVLVQLRKLTADGKLTKIKNSFKLPLNTKPHPAKSASAKPKSTSAAAKSKAAAAKPKSKPKPKAKPAAASKLKPKTVAKPKAVKPKTKTAAIKPKVKVPPAKVAKKSLTDMPSKKKLVGPAKKKTAPTKLKAVKPLVNMAAVAGKKGKASPARKVLARKVKK